MKKCCGKIMFSILILLFLLAGCGKAVTEEGVKESDTSSESGAGIPAELPEIDLSFLQESGFRDNTMDAYMAVSSQRLELSRPDGEIGGSTRFVLTGDEGLAFQRHLLQSAEESWDEIACVTSEGDKKSVRLDDEREDELFRQAFALGTTADSGRFLVEYLEMGEKEDGSDLYRYYLRELDENLESTGKSMELGFLEGDRLYFLDEFLRDPQGRVHMLLSKNDDNNKNKYVMTSPEGELLLEYEFDEGEGHGDGLALLPDGTVSIRVSRVQFKDGNTVDKEWNELWLLDPEGGEPKLWSSIEISSQANTLFFSDYERYDEEHLLRVDRTGLYLCDREGNHPEYLYQWRTHGISINELREVRMQEDKGISLLCSDEEGEFFLKLEPVTEKQEIRRITLAAPVSKRNAYSTVVAEFNKRYPAYHVDLKTDYEEAALLTELISGKGPELIDTSLVGLEDHTNLWLPLDGIFEQLGLTEELYPKAMELGKADGKLYGIVSNFELATAVTADKSLKDWDYETFLERVRKGDMKYVYDSYKEDGGLGFLEWFLCHSLKDNYLIDVQEKKTIFRTEAFQEILDLAETYCPYGENVPGEEGLLEGDVLCNVVYIRRPEDIAYYRVRYGDSLEFVGFPAGDGSRQYVMGDSAIAIRGTAEKEDLELALLFFDHMLSAEAQRKAAKDTAFALSVRKDILQEQIDAMNEETLIRGYGTGQGVPLGDKLDREQDEKTLYGLLEQAVPWESFPPELETILAEELGPYFAGTAERAEMINRLDNRVQLYLNERK